MTTDATRQLEDALFFAALHLPEPELRRQFLERACYGDDALRASVDKMLSAHAEAERFFARGASTLRVAAPPPAPPAEEDEAPADSPAPNHLAKEKLSRRIGRYKLLERLGEGGCGVVYMAEQKEPLRRLTALKVIKLGMDTKRVIARFEAERQALAMMDHPNIAQVLDAGATETGRPYFVMELVRGVKITEYCDHGQLDVRQRLELFIQICHAVQHAHQKGVIHRDIKPSNIMVTLHDGVPVPKVIDFGIAKATEGKLTDQTLFTACEQLVGTPAYMSPEQADMSALDVDTRTDIYSLGVLLYELLTGRTPFDSKRLLASGLDHLRRTLREQEPQRPSTILTTLEGADLNSVAACRHEDPPKFISLLKGDLDWIVMKALEKDRSRRYETANALAMEVQRYLNNEPVLARPPSRLYRLRKLVRRNRVVFAAGAAVVAALVIGLGASTWLFFQEREARRWAVAAEQEQVRLRQEAEAREKINQAAIYVSQEKYSQANQLLNQIKAPPPKPSFDGVAAFRSVGEWLALQSRWTESAERFSALMDIDKLDKWGPVTLDYQACGVVLAECGDAHRYERFCQEAIASFSTTTNGDAASRILKTCLLLPADQKLLNALRPLADCSERFFDPMPAQNFPVWATIPLSLWKYRCGDYDKAIHWCQLELSGTSRIPALDATIRVIYALSSYGRGQVAAARSELAEARQSIESKFKNGLDRGNATQGFWYDWVFARILLREAEIQIGGKPALNNSQPAAISPAPTRNQTASPRS